MTPVSPIIADFKEHEERDLNPELARIFRDLGEKSEERELGPDLADIALARQVASMATTAMQEIDASLTGPERTRRRQLALLTNENVATIAGTLPERLFRTKDPQQQWQALMEVVSMVAIPEDMSTYEKLGLKVASSKAWSAIPGLKLAMGMAKRHVLGQIGDFVKIFNDSDPSKVVSAMERESKRSGIGYEINLVTESARTQAEAHKNISWYKQAIASGAKRIAIKPTSLVPFSDAAIAKPESKKKLTEALCLIFKEAEQFTNKGQPGPIITIDSERSDIVDMTKDAFIEAAKRHPKVRVQIALQAYLKDTEQLMLEPLLAASKSRKANGGVPLGVRLVNGANQKGEEWLASANGWRRTPLVESKPAAHANFMRLREQMTQAVKDGEFTLTIGSMNLLTLIHSLVTLAKAGVFADENAGFVNFAMLRGMTGQEVFRHLQKKYGIEGHEYIPCIPKKVVVELFKYYLRRIDELAGAKGEFANYLGVLAAHGANSAEWAQTQVKFGLLAALSHYRNTSYPLEPGIDAYRGDNEPVVESETLEEFKPTPNIAPGNVEDSNWIDDRIGACQTRTAENAETVAIPFEKANFDEEQREERTLFGPTRPELPLIKYTNYTKADIDHSFKTAREQRKNPNGWGNKSIDQRIDTISKVAGRMRANRAALDESLILNTGKPILEADGEVNEAMDFLNLSGLQMKKLLERDNLEFGTEGDGTAVVVCPKNFPQAIPAAHIAARLLAGYSVIVKPSGGEGEESVWATYELCKCFWEAGIPKDALQFVPCSNENAAHLTKHAERVGYTGSTHIAKKIREANPDLDIIAETGGRNFIILDSTSDLKAVATEILKATCGFAGQKCSKPVAVIATEDVDMEEFKTHLLGQLKEMLLENALVRHTDAPPLTKQYLEESNFYKKIMECLDGEEWLEGEIPTGLLDSNGRDATKHVSAKPEKMGDPGIRIIKDATNFDWSKIEEIFAPIISIAQIKGNAIDAIDIVNGLKGSLTGSIFSQNRATIQYATKHWKTGNLYINKQCTGALGHQGFGDGTGDSHEGAHGAKTGTIEWLIANSCVRRKKGKHVKYKKVETANDPSGLAPLLQTLEEKLSQTGASDEELQNIIHAGWSYLHESETYFTQKRKAPYQTIGQYDWIESHNIGPVVLRVSTGDTTEEILNKAFSAIVAGNPLTISVPQNMFGAMEKIKDLLGAPLDSLFPFVTYSVDNDEQFDNHIEENNGKIGLILFSNRSKVPKSTFEKAYQTSTHIDCRETTGDGLIDMFTQFRQQSYCQVFHTAGDTSYEDAIEKQHPEEVPYLRAA